MTDKPRKYSAIWDKIKKKETCNIEVPPFFVARVKKAVIKEKSKDLAFKVLNEHDVFFLDIIVVPVSVTVSKITFKLRQRYGLEGRKD